MSYAHLVVIVRYAVFIAPWAVSLSLSCLACQLHGSDSGICTDRYLPATFGGGLEDIEDAAKQWQNGTDGPCKEGQADHCMPFCGRWIASYYRPCIPAPMFLLKDQNFPEGRHGKHTVREKDRWVEETVTAIIDARIAVESNITAQKLGVDENGVKGRKTAVRFYGNPDCRHAYKRYFCWLNFPRCDEFNDTLPMCESACENFFRVCGFEEEMWRCNESPKKIEQQLDQDITPKKPDISSFFPGQPFKQNEFIPKSDGEPKTVCTPSIKGGALGRFTSWALLDSLILSGTMMWLTRDCF